MMTCYRAGMLAGWLNDMEKDKKTGKTEYSAPWVIIPPTVLGDERLSAGAKLVYGRVFGFMQKHGYCLASNDYLSRYIGMSKNTLRNYLSRLYDLGYLRYELIRDERNEVVERRIYPTLVPPAVLPSTAESTTPSTAESMTPHTAESTKEINVQNEIDNVYVMEERANREKGEEYKRKVDADDANAKIEYFAELLAGILNDHASISYYRKACRGRDPVLLLDKAKQIVADGGARKPAAVFTAWLKQGMASQGM
jgi:hypothetical protein